MTTPDDAAVDAAPPGVRDTALVTVGGVVGAELRYAVARALPHPVGGWPWSTLVVNVAGSFALAVVLGLLARRDESRTPRLLIGTGLLGGFTTFSTFAVDWRALAVHGRPALALAYLAVTLAGVVLAVLLGRRLTRSRR